MSSMELIMELGEQLKLLQQAGLTPEEIGTVLTRRAQAKGLSAIVRVSTVPNGFTGLDIELGAPAAAAVAKKAPASSCPHPHCGSFLYVACIGEANPPLIRLLTEEELLALSDESRINLQRARRMVQARRTTN